VRTRARLEPHARARDGRRRDGNRAGCRHPRQRGWTLFRDAFWGEISRARRD